ncbi:hypothetical protein PRIPAC_73968, partial [Pristionchus pacificus]
FVLFSLVRSSRLSLLSPSSNRMGNNLNRIAGAGGPSDRDAAGGTAVDATGVSTTTIATGKTDDGITDGTGGAGAQNADVIRDWNVEAIEPDLDQCGLDPDPEGRMVAVWTPDPRIKESILTPEERIEFRALIDRIFEKIAVSGKRVHFSPREVLDVMTKVIPYLESEPMLIEDVPFDITIVGDLHGQFHDLARVFADDEKDGKSAWEIKKYLFLGNYIGRGRQSLEIVMALFCIKMLYPDRIFLLRGNHEFISVCPRTGFIQELHDRYCEETFYQLCFKVNEAFCYLSAAAIVGNTYFCSHAGMSPQAFTRRQMLGYVNRSSTRKATLLSITRSGPISTANWASPHSMRVAALPTLSELKILPSLWTMLAVEECSAVIRLSRVDSRSFAACACLSSRVPD